MRKTARETLANVSRGFTPVVFSARLLHRARSIPKLSRLKARTMPLIEKDERKAKNPASSVREYYNHVGWTIDESGAYSDTRAFVDGRAVPLQYTHRCMKRLNKYFRKGGRYLLDAGSGPIPHNEYLSYSDPFEHRLCLDFSLSGLRIAKSKLRDKGFYVQGDITNIPLKSGTMDAVTCNHVLYHVAADQQKNALLELWRCLRPGSVAVVVYAWAWESALMARGLGKLARLLVRQRDVKAPPKPQLYYYAHSLKWFESQKWPFRYKIDTFRVVDNEFMRQYIGDGWIGRLTLWLLYFLQTCFPTTCGKYGRYPAIIIYKE
jgi:SAM-dependent methyltransferase